MSVSTTYLVCSTERSGSSLLCDLLHSTGIAGDPQEYFSPEFEGVWAKRWSTSTFAGYLECAVETTSTPNGVFGAKIMYEHLDYLTGNIARLMPESPTSNAARLRAAFTNLHFVFIRRHDIVRQAVSHWRATQTAIWNDDGRGGKPVREPEFDFAAIDRCLHRIAHHNSGWRAFFERNAIEPMRVMYETLAESPDRTTRKVVDFLDLTTSEEFSIAPPRLLKQADALSEEWVRRYEEERLRQSRPTKQSASSYPVTVLRK